jgi:hypothetical protein
MNMLKAWVNLHCGRIPTPLLLDLVITQLCLMLDLEDKGSDSPKQSSWVLSNMHMSTLLKKMETFLILLFIKLY